MENLTVFVDYKISQVVGIDVDEPSFCISDINGRIYDFDDDDNEVTVGKVSLYYCDLEKALNNGISTFNVLDAHSSSTERYYSHLFDSNTEEVNQSILKILGYENDDVCFDINFLIIDRIELLPKFRSKGLSKVILEEAIKMFSNKTFAVVLEPFPLQGEPGESRSDESELWHKKMSYSTFKEDEKEAKEALKNHYKKLGFVDIPNSNFMICTNEEWV